MNIQPIQTTSQRTSFNRNNSASEHRKVNISNPYMTRCKPQVNFGNFREEEAKLMDKLINAADEAARKPIAEALTNLRATAPDSPFHHIHGSLDQGSSINWEDIHYG